MHKPILNLIMVSMLALAFIKCDEAEKTTGKKILKNPEKSDSSITIVNKNADKIASRFNTPESFQRIKVRDNSFGKHLRNLHLKPHGASVLYYNGSKKPNNGVYDAVVNLPIGNRNLHQCADAVMRLRAEYLYSQKQYDKIHFNFTNGFKVSYSEWIKGKRIVVKGNKSYWVKKAEPSNTHKDLENYLQVIYTYAGSLSLSKELKSVQLKEMQIGDVFIQGGTPGHAIIVMDMAINKNTGEKLFMLAQSYMPAQEIQILTNPENKKISPWYSLEFEDILNTPEWTFYANDLMRFEN